MKLLLKFVCRNSHYHLLLEGGGSSYEDRIILISVSLSVTELFGLFTYSCKPTRKPSLSFPLVGVSCTKISMKVLLIRTNNKLKVCPILSNDFFAFVCSFAFFTLPLIHFSHYSWSFDVRQISMCKGDWNQDGVEPCATTTADSWLMRWIHVQSGSSTQQ